MPRRSLCASTFPITAAQPGGDQGAHSGLQVHASGMARNQRASRCRLVFIRRSDILLYAEPVQSTGNSVVELRPACRRRLTGRPCGVRFWIRRLISMNRLSALKTTARRQEQIEDGPARKPISRVGKRRCTRQDFGEHNRDLPAEGSRSCQTCPRHYSASQCNATEPEGVEAFLAVALSTIAG